MLAAIVFGSFFVGSARASMPTVIITEIGAHAPSGEEWVAVKNIADRSFQLDEWSFWEGETNHGLRLVSGSSTLLAGEHAYIAQDGDAFARTHPSTTVFDSAWGSLKLSGEEIGLRNATGTLIEVFRYPLVSGLLSRQCELCDSSATSTWYGVIDTVQAVTSTPIATSTPIVTSTLEMVPDVATSTATLMPTTTQETVVIAPQRTPPPLARFAPGVIIVNELISNPIREQTEFIELKNRANQSIDLSGWYIEDLAGVRSLLDGAIETFFVLEQPKGKLNNGGDSVYLYDPAGTLIDKVTYGDGGVPAPGKGESLSKFGNEWEISLAATPGQENIFMRKVESPILESKKNESEPKRVEPMREEDVAIEEVYDYTGLVIAEVFPNPDGPDVIEEIVIRNDTHRLIDVFGLVVDDEEGGSRPHRIATHQQLHFGETFVIEKKDSLLSLNNSGDEVRLFDALGEEVDAVKYGATESGERLVLIDGTYIWTGSEEELEEDIIQSVSLSDITELEVGTVVEAVGTVSVLPGMYGSQYGYFVSHDVVTKEAFVGVQFYRFDKRFLELELGDVVHVLGEVSQPKSGPRVKVKEMRIEGKRSLVPRTIEIVDITDETIGTLVSIRGEIIEKNGRGFHVDDGTGEVRVYIKNTVAVDRKALQVGHDVHVVGTIVRGSGGLQVLPRLQSDVVVVAQEDAGLDSIELPSSTQIIHKAVDGDEHSLPKKSVVGAGAAVLALLGRRYAVPLAKGLLKKT